MVNYTERRTGGFPLVLSTFISGNGERNVHRNYVTVWITDHCTIFGRIFWSYMVN